MSNKIQFDQREDLELQQITNESSLDWLTPSRTEALALFKAAKLPNRKVEHWKYNDMTFLTNDGYSPAKALDSSVAADLAKTNKSIKFDDAIELVFVDGFLTSNLSQLKLPAGLSLVSFEQANLEQQAIISAHISPEFSSKNCLLNLNEAIAENGILIHVAANSQITTPVYLRYISSSSSESSISSQRLKVTLETNAELTLVEEFSSKDLNQDKTQDQQQLALQQTSFELAANSSLHHYRLNIESDQARQISQVKTTLAKDSRLNSFYFGLGSRLNRTDIDVIHNGTNGESFINGIYLPRNEQAIDYHSNLEHRAAHCNSTEVFRGIIADKASATFNGKIHIFQDAQKSDAQLSNKNLLLSNQAQINTKPELEIYADDVKCAHGATVAQLDDKSLYYMQTRGINKLAAQKMLSIAFIQELLNAIKLKPVQIFLSDLLDRYMEKVA